MEQCHLCELCYVGGCNNEMAVLLTAIRYSYSHTWRL